MTVEKTDPHKVITKLNDAKMKLLCLRAEPPTEERPTSAERKKIIQGRSQIKRGRPVTLAQLRKEFGA